jgi:cell wall-associated NlpC family hydrolase
LPRSTEAQARIGEPIAISELRTGDLVFFKTSWKTGHVGIYLNDGFFMHASTTKGVMISSLENPYWKKTTGCHVE